MNRNCGRTGPTSEAGKLRSAQNSFKHGGCSARLILPGESEEEWQELLARWHKTYEPEPDSLSYDFVQRAAEADWRRLRNLRHYDDYLFLRLEGRAPYDWNADEIKIHDLLLRYKTTAERSFQRDVRALDQHYRVHCPKKLEPKATEKPKPSLTIIGVDRNSPTGYSLVREMVEGKEYRQDGPCNCTALQAEACTTSRRECLSHEPPEGSGGT